MNRQIIILDLIWIALSLICYLIWSGKVALIAAALYYLLWFVVRFITATMDSDRTKAEGASIAALWFAGK